MDQHAVVLLQIEARAMRSRGVASTHVQAAWTADLTLVAPRWLPILHLLAFIVPGRFQTLLDVGGVDVDAEHPPLLPVGPTLRHCS